jgi:hypothetical protein
MGFDSSVFRQISTVIKQETTMTKTKIFENKITRERYICDNIRMVRRLDGVEYLSVRKENEERKFLIRRDSLQEVVET